MTAQKAHSTASKMFDEFEIDIALYESMDRKDPTDTRVIELLAQLYTRVGRIQDGLAMDQRLAILKPNDPTVAYNLACSLSLIGQTEESIAALKKAVALGYSDLAWMRKDPDLEGVRGLPEFLTLLGS
jgi:predicted Zn-dependent protease